MKEFLAGLLAESGSLSTEAIILRIVASALISAAMQMTVLIIFFIFVLFFWLQSYAENLKAPNIFHFICILFMFLIIC